MFGRGLLVRSFIWSLTKVEPFTALSKVVNPPLLSLLDALIGFTILLLRLS